MVCFSLTFTRELLLGIASNRHLKDLDLDLSSNELGSQGAHIIASCISNIQCLGRLDISNNSMLCVVHLPYKLVGGRIARGGSSV